MFVLLLLGFAISKLPTVGHTLWSISPCFTVSLSTNSSRMIRTIRKLAIHSVRRESVSARNAP